MFFSVFVVQNLRPVFNVFYCQGVPHLIQPVLITGTKIWHLRPDSVFYTKQALHNALGSGGNVAIPKAATVIVCLGEIDCREGLLQAVERCKYEVMYGDI